MTTVGTRKDSTMAGNRARNRTGDVSGIFTCTGPVAEDWRKTLYWHFRCGNCGNVIPVSVKSIPNLKTQKGCCKCGGRANKQ